MITTQTMSLSVLVTFEKNYSNVLVFVGCDSLSLGNSFTESSATSLWEPQTPQVLWWFLKCELSHISTTATLLLLGEWYKWPTKCNNNNFIDLWIVIVASSRSFILFTYIDDARSHTNQIYCYYYYVCWLCCFFTWEALYGDCNE
jgi:hypothetical protein